jgi:hypothetical protein
VAEFGAATAFFGAIPTHGMMGRMLFADSGTELAHFDAERAEADSKSGGPSHPLRRKDTNIRAIATQSDAANHQVAFLFLFRHLHADHIVPTGITYACTVQAGLNAFEAMLIH